MKKYTFLSIVVTIVALLFPIGDSVKASSQSKPMGEVRIILTNLWNEALDPMLSQSAGRRGLMAIYDSLVGAKPDGSAYSKETGVAKNWELSPDGKTWTFHLRKGIQFHRGFGELTADDVKFSLDRIKSERSMAARRGYFKKNIGKIEVVDKYTVKVHSTGVPIPDFLAIMSVLYDSIEQLIVSKRAVEELGNNGFASNPVGSGPYQFAEHVGGQYIKLKAVENHWRIGTPRFKYLYFLAVPEEETAIGMLARGDADLVPISRSNVRRVKKKGFDVIIQKNSGGVWLWLDDQWVEGPPAHNEKVREALNLAIDRQIIVDTVFEGMGKPFGSFYGTSIAFDNMGYNWREDLYPYDPKKARKLLAEAGYPDGFDMDVYMYPYVEIPESHEVMQIVAGMWSKIGVRPRLISTEYGVVRAKLFKGEFPGAAGFFPLRSRPWPAMLGFYRQFLHSTGVVTFIKSDEMDRMLDKASQSFDPEVSKANLRAAAKYVRKHHIAFPICEFDVPYAVSKKVAHWDPGSLPAFLNLDNLFGRQ